MTRQQALALARKKYGKQSFIREDKNAADPETREIMKHEVTKLMEQKPVPPPPTPEEIAYQKAYRIWREQKDRLHGRIWRRRWDIGYITEAGFGHIVGSGDTIGEACQKAGLE